MKVLSETESPLLSRRRLVFELEHPKQATPTKIKLEEDIAKKLNTTKDLVAIKHVYTKFGSGKSKVITNVYTDLKTKELLEKKPKKMEAKPAA